MKLRYTALAAAELAALLDDIAGHSPNGARKALLRTREVERHIARFPKLGSPALRAMLTLPYPDVFLYEERRDEVVVHRIRHTAQQR